MRSGKDSSLVVLEEGEIGDEVFNDVGWTKQSVV